MTFNDIGLTALTENGMVKGFEVRLPRPILRIEKDPYKDDIHQGVCEAGDTIFTNKDETFIDYSVELFKPIPLEKLNDYFEYLLMSYPLLRKCVANIRARKRLLGGDVRAINLKVVCVQ